MELVERSLDLARMLQAGCPTTADSYRARSPPRPMPTSPERNPLYLDAPSGTEVVMSPTGDAKTY